MFYKNSKHQFYGCLLFLFKDLLKMIYKGAILCKYTLMGDF
ncbi:hypothetical protein SAMN04488576_101704 [Bacillus sp. cl25]|uniref:Uncharacterized protein n=1 Tax=Bacillus cereus VD184 TaxID=1053242 RepID=A0A9W5R151_BACCE|nr:hypothetical protein IKC_04533 [Bacillus cereus VD184]SDI85531.1 hypothetical protein SAMN04488578_108244 [Bacillus sp. cl96]SEB16748.1 hypothetical protein SAMN04488575_12437 [Bacillus sp. cl115]SHI98386.1 hypothetical protein SAMN04488576_101704 [Bacillus sp. cl25]SMD87061.1 hypothetical protein BACERE00187_01768 [Bacillus cereus]